MADIFEMEIFEFNEKINEARTIATDNILVKASLIDADAIIGIYYNYMVIGSNMMAVMVTGTAVNIEAS